MIVKVIETWSVGNGVQGITTLEWDPFTPHIVELVDTRSDNYQSIHAIPRPYLLDAANLDPSADHSVPSADDIELHVYPTGWESFEFVRRPHLPDYWSTPIPREAVISLVTESMRVIPFDREDELVAWKSDLYGRDEDWALLFVNPERGCDFDCPCGGRNAPRL